MTIDERFAALRGAKILHAKPLDHFGRNPHGYDLGGADGTGDDEADSKSFEEADYGDGAPGKELVADALRVWAAGWQRFDLETAATVFHMTPELVWQVQPMGFLGKTPEQAGAFDIAVQLLSSQRHYNSMCDAEGNALAGAFDNLDAYLNASVAPTVAETAALLNVSEDAVKRAVESHYWMLLGPERDGSPTIEHEGE